MNEDDFNNIRERIGENLIRLRKEKGYTSYESFAMDFDIPRAYYWQIENGKANFTFKMLLKILKAHGITAEEFFKRCKND